MKPSAISPAIIAHYADRADAASVLIDMFPEVKPQSLRPVLCKYRRTHGIKVRRGPPDKPALTARIARLSAGGMRNKDIAVLLSMEPSAVSYHVRKAQPA